MTVDQVAINHRAVTTQAERLTATGWDGDAHRFVESLLLNATADGYRRIEAPPPLRGRGGTREGIDAALSATETAVRQAKDRRKKPAELAGEAS